MNSPRSYLIIKSCCQIAILLLGMFLLGCKASPKIVWQFHTGGPLNHPPAIAGEKVIVGSEDSYLYALDSNNGKVLWKTFLGDRVLVTPVVEKNVVYTGTAGGDFFALDANTGKVQWKYQAGGMLEYDPCVDADGIYFGSYNGKLNKINRQGSLIWSFPTPFYITSSCVFYKDLVITSSWDHNVYGIRRENGTEVWKFNTGEYSYGAPLVVGDRGYYLTHDQFIAFHPDTGKIFFRDKMVYANNVVAYKNALYTPENGITKRSLDGKVLNSTEFKFKSFSDFCPTIVGPYVVISDTTTHLYGFSPDTLEVKWKFNGKDLFWCPGVERNGIYYIGNGDGTLYALRLP